MSPELVSASDHRWAATRSLRGVAAFVTVELAVLVAIVTQVHSKVLPDKIASQVGHNSEAFALAILLSATIAWLRPRGGARTLGQWAAVGAVTSGLVALGVIMLDLTNPRLKTLNEAVFGAAVLCLYCALPRRHRLFGLASPALLVLTIVFFSTDLVLDQAESIVALILAPIGLDIFDRGLLRSERTSSRWLVLGWSTFLLAAPFVLMALKQIDLGGTLDEAVFYAARGNEAFWGLFLVHFLGIVAWQTSAPGDRRPARELARPERG